MNEALLRRAAWALGSAGVGIAVYAAWITGVVLVFRDMAERFAKGQVQPANLEGALQYMGLVAEDRGRDGDQYAWAESFRKVRKAG